MSYTDSTYEAMTIMSEQIRNNTADISKLPDNFFYCSNDYYIPNYRDHLTVLNDSFSKIRNDYLIHLIKNFPDQIPDLHKTNYIEGMIQTAIISCMYNDADTAALLTKNVIKYNKELNNILDNLLKAALYINCTPVLDCISTGFSCISDITSNVTAIIDIETLKQIYHTNRADIFTNMFRDASIDDISNILHNNGFYNESDYIDSAGSELTVFEYIYYFLETVLTQLCPKEELHSTIEKLFNSCGVFNVILNKVTFPLLQISPDYWKTKLEAIRKKGVHISNISFVPTLLSSVYDLLNSDRDAFLQFVRDQLLPILDDELYIYIHDLEIITSRPFLTTPDQLKITELFNIFIDAANKKITADFTPHKAFYNPDYYENVTVDNWIMKLFKNVTCFRWDDCEDDASHKYEQDFVRNNPAVMTNLVKRGIFSHSHLNSMLDIALELKNYELLNTIRKQLLNRADAKVNSAQST